MKRPVMRSVMHFLARTLRHVLIVLGLCVLGHIPPAVADIIVRPDGTGDYPTIQEAIDSIEDEDTIILTDGVFTGGGNWELQIHGLEWVTIQSQSGNPATCYLELQGKQLAGVGDGTAEFRDLGFHNGDACQAGYMTSVYFEGCRFEAMASVSQTMEGHLQFDDCLFIDGIDYQLHGAYAYDCSFTGCNGIATGHELVMEDCLVTGNSRDGALFAMEGESSYYGGGNVHFLRTVFSNNQCAALIEALCCTVDMDECLAYANAGTTLVWDNDRDCQDGYYDALELEGCTFAGNESSGSAELSIAISPQGEGTYVIRECIVAFNANAAAVEYTGPHSLIPAFECTALFGNAGGDWTGVIADQLGQNGNIHLDPVFCDLPGGDLTIAESSPCAPFSPPNSECPLIGALPVGCQGTPAESATWGSIKSRYR